MCNSKKVCYVIYEQGAYPEFSLVGACFDLETAITICSDNNSNNLPSYFQPVTVLTKDDYEEVEEVDEEDECCCYGCNGSCREETNSEHTVVDSSKKCILHTGTDYVAIKVDNKPVEFTIDEDGYIRVK